MGLANFEAKDVVRLDALLEDRWFTLILDLEHFSRTLFSQRLEAFTKVTVNADCRIKKMFSLRHFDSSAQLGTVFSGGREITCQFYSDFASSAPKPSSRPSMMQVSRVLRLESQTETRQEDGRVSSKVLTYCLANPSLVQSSSEHQ